MNRDYNILKEDFLRAGIKKGDSLFLHSSYRSMGGIEGGIETFVNALLSVIGDTGTLLAPAFTFRVVTEDNPVFIYETMPSCVGAISEFIRNINGAKRSINPTHSCSALGFKSDFYVKDHEKDNTPTGVNSALYKLKEEGGKILMLGCNIAHNTTMHSIEENFRVPYVFDITPKKYTIIKDGKATEIDYFRHYIQQNGYSAKYGRITDVLGDKIINTEIHGAKSYIFNAPEIWDECFKVLKTNPYYFVDKVED